MPSGIMPEGHPGEPGALREKPDGRHCLTAGFSFKTRETGQLRWTQFPVSIDGVAKNGNFVAKNGNSSLKMELFSSLKMELLRV